MIFIILSSGCSITPDLSQLDDISHPKQIVNFQMLGKIAVKTPYETKSASLFWQQNNSNYHLQLSTYLGIQVAEISGNKHKIKISADGEKYQSNDPEGLILSKIGWQIPIADLSNWIKGLHKGVVISKHPDGSAKKVLIRTSPTQEWVVDYLSYEKLHKVKLPSKIKCKHLDNTIILQINEWKNMFKTTCVLN